MGPRRKRMKRPGRLQAAREWLDGFGGKNVVRGYAKSFGVDLQCAIAELRLVGVELEPAYVERVMTMLRSRGKPRAPRPADGDGLPEGYRSEWDDHFAYIAGFTPGGAPFGTIWDELADLEIVEPDDDSPDAGLHKT